MPLQDGRTYWYAAANAHEGQRNPDEHETLCQRFGTWHEPIPTFLAHTPTQAVLRHDIYRLPPVTARVLCAGPFAWVAAAQQA